MFGISWWIWAGAALIVAIIYAFVYPQPGEGVTLAAWQSWVLRWGHTAVWVVLAASCVIRALSPQSAGIANNIAFLALPLYGLFLFTMVGIRQ
jgi:hypothetical protein